MSGIKSGAAKQICDIQSSALFTHCYDHALNLVASDVLKQSKLMRDALDLAHEITKLIKCSRHKEGTFQDLKEKLEGGSTRSIRVLYPTRWTVKANSLTSILNNYMKHYTNSYSRYRGKGMNAWCICSNVQLRFFYGCMLGKLILNMLMT